MSDPLLQPFDLGHLTLKNRIFSSSHAPGYNTDGTPNEKYVRYHLEKAAGGIGMTMIGGSSNVSPDSASLWGQLYFGTDAIIDPLREMVDQIHSHGTAVMTQLTHMGRRNVSNEGDWLPLVAPSPIREPMHRNWPKEIDKADIGRIVADFGAAAKRAQLAGIDGVELTATSHLIDQFWTPLANRRTDEYGGSLENRLRFVFEVIESIRESVGDTMLLGIRMIGKENQVGGLSQGESIEIAQRLATSGFLDFINVSYSSLATDEGLSKNIPPSGTPLMGNLPVATAIKDVVDLPVLHASRITDLSSARHAISEGLIDLAGMTRAHMADPHIVAKLERGDADRIRVCVGASMCINRLHLGLESVCIQNPATGRETHIPQLITKTAGSPKKVVVIGGGPAGLEAARVCAERGHAVVLFEAQAQLGGQVVLAARASERQSELAGITGWLEQEVRVSGVDVRVNSPVDAANVMAENADVVIVATGGWPDTDFLDGHGQELVMTSWDVLAGHAQPTGAVLIYDDHGSERAASVAEFLTDREMADHVDFVSPDRQIVQDLSSTTGPEYLKMLYERGVAMTPDHRVVDVSRADGRLTVTLRNEFSRVETERTVDAVVVEHGVIPESSLYQALRGTSSNNGVTNISAILANEPQPEVSAGEGFALYRIGDAVASRDIASALYDARRLCQSL